MDRSAKNIISDIELTDDDRRLSDIDVATRLHYISFASGSSGNSCYVGNKDGGVVIDAGIRADPRYLAAKRGADEQGEGLDPHSRS